MSYREIIRRSYIVYRYTRDHGLLSTLKQVSVKLKKLVSGRNILKTDVLEKLEVVRLSRVSEELVEGEVEGNTINWIVPPFGRGSGGHLNIFRFISNLEKLGFECRVVIVGMPQPFSASHAKEKIAEFFFHLKANVFLENDNIPAAYYTIATEWKTAYWVRNYPATKYRCYFVQDFEPWFYAVGSTYILAEETYRFGFIGITAGRWLKNKLSSEYKMTTYDVGFSYDREIYRPLPRDMQSKKRSVLFYSRPSTPRRGFELGLLVFESLLKISPDIEIIFAGWNISEYEIPYKVTSVGILSPGELPNLYSRCDAALVLSLTNLSLLPLELMACGVPVVSNKGPWTEWLLNDDNSRLAVATVPDLVEALWSVLSNPGEAQRLREGGFKTAASSDWFAEASKMADILRIIDSCGQELANDASSGVEK